MTNATAAQPLHRAALALGSNVGDRLATLQAALDRLGDVPELRVVKVSPVFETDPVGGPAQPQFLNAVVVADTRLSPRQLLVQARAVEDALGRVRATRWGPRTIDVDVLVVGDLVVDEPDLQVPHPRAAGRAFVLAPWAHVDPDACMPDGTSVAELARRVGGVGVRARADLTLVPTGPGSRR